ncbi:MAG: NAD-dependent epimerase/dehydratase family protein [Candidatus Dormibacteraeota bacterium]|nr:NAD-dependent epimerase/dehydratase family protein [Candidatus Dormibacteraeota bacterium]
MLLPAAHQRLSDYLGDHELIRGDLRDPSVAERVLSEVDAVCHQSAMVGLGVDAQDAPEYVSHNALATAVLLAAMDRCGVVRLVLASSMVVYGEGAYSCVEHGDVRPGARAEADLAAGLFESRCPSCGAPLESATVSEDAPADPRNTYAATKLAQEHLAWAWARPAGRSVAALRYHNVYGPRMPRDTPYAGVASIFRSSLAAGQAPQVFEDGGQRRDFVHVGDVALANVLALERAHPPAFRAYNIASGTPHTVGDMASALAGAFGGPAPVVTGCYRLGDVRHIVASPARAADELGFRAAVGFAEGMAQFAHAPLR